MVRITAIHENPSMMGGKVLVELSFDREDGDAVAMSFPLFHEAYDTHILWVWSQVDLADTMADDAFWSMLSEGLGYNLRTTPPSGPELRVMAEQRIAEGNEPGFDQRIG